MSKDSQLSLDGVLFKESELGTQWFLCVSKLMCSGSLARKEKSSSRSIRDTGTVFIANAWRDEKSLTGKQFPLLCCILEQLIEILKWAHRTWSETWRNRFVSPSNCGAFRKNHKDPLVEAGAKSNMMVQNLESKEPYCQLSVGGEWGLDGKSPFPGRMGLGSGS